MTVVNSNNKSQKNVSRNAVNISEINLDHIRTGIWHYIFYQYYHKFTLSEKIYLQVCTTL